jgi:hypothetical protein
MRTSAASAASRGSITQGQPPACITPKKSATASTPREREALASLDSQGQFERDAAVTLR